MKVVGVPGLEPGKAGPESAVLPITPYPKHCRRNRDALSITPANLLTSPRLTKVSRNFSIKNSDFVQNISEFFGKLSDFFENVSEMFLQLSECFSRG